MIVVVLVLAAICSRKEKQLLDLELLRLITVETLTASADKLDEPKELDVLIFLIIRRCEEKKIKHDIRDIDMFVASTIVKLGENKK